MQKLNTNIRSIDTYIRAAMNGGALFYVPKNEAFKWNADSLNGAFNDSEPFDNDEVGGFLRVYPGFLVKDTEFTNDNHQISIAQPKTNWKLAKKYITNMRKVRFFCCWIPKWP